MLFRFFVVLLSILSCSQAMSLSTGQPEHLLLTLTINDVLQAGYYHAYLDNNHQLWLDEADLIAVKFPAPSIAPVLYNEHNYLPLEAYEGLKYHLDKKSLSLTIQTPISWIMVNDLHQPSIAIPPLKPEKPGLFFNYDITHRQIDFNPQSYFAGLGEAGIFTYYGVGTSSFVISNQDYLLQQTHALRLDTTWIIDQPDHMSSWRFGDSVTSGLTWSGATRFAGIQYATNFNTQPAFITFPQPAFRGEAIVPSTVDVFVNDSLTFQKAVNRGPFYVNQLPVITGAGTVQVVTRDLLGREQSVSMPYYASPALLKSGLSDYSVEAGSVRSNYGLHNNDYGRFLGVGTYSLGVTDWYTTGVHAEVLENQQTAGFLNHLLVNNWGVLSLGAAGSRSDRGLGALASAGFRRQTTVLSYGVQATLASPDYMQIGTFDNCGYPAFTVQSFIGLSTENLGSFSLTYTDLNNSFNKQKEIPYIYWAPEARIVLASYSKNLFGNIFLTMGALTDLRNTGNKQIFASFVMPIDDTKSLSINGINQPGDHQENIQLMKNLPLGNGYGYRLSAASNTQPRMQGEFAVQNTLGLFGAKYARFEQTNNYELDARGSVIDFDHQLFMARHVDQSFALVHVPDAQAIDVYYRNQLVGKTNKAGYLYVPDLLPYQANEIKILPQDLGLNQRIDDYNKVVVPYYRSGALINFTVKTTHNVLLTLNRATGGQVPTGAVVFLDNHPDISYPVGYNGQVFIDAATSTVLQGRAVWPGRSCSFALNLNESQRAITQESSVCH